MRRILLALLALLMLVDVSSAQQAAMPASDEEVAALQATAVDVPQPTEKAMRYYRSGVWSGGSTCSGAWPFPV